MNPITLTPTSLRRRTLLAGLLTAAALVVSGLAMAAPAARASSPGANGRIVFSRCEDGTTCAVGAVWIMNADGSGQARLLSDPEHWNDDPAFSADGRTVAFQRCAPGGACGIATVDVHGNNLKQVSAPATAPGDDYPSLSPGGDRIAFARYTPGTAAIWIMGADGSNPHALTDAQGTDSLPQFSPDGTKIAFRHYAAGVGYRIWLMNADGSNQHALTDDPDRADTAPTFSPDGTKIAFGGCDKANKCAIWVINVDGTGAHQVTTPALGDHEPAFSPDGTQLIFERDQPDDSQRLFTQPLAGGSATQLTTGNDWRASWGRIPTPSIDSPPTVAGDARAGHTLTATAGATSWGGTTSLQWLRCAASCTPIQGATGSTYRVTNADLGSHILVQQTQASAGGAVTALSASSADVAAEPGVAIARKLVRLRGGRLVAKLTCPAEQSGFCQGGLILSTVKHGHRVRVASGSFQLTAATTANLTLRASKQGRALLAKKRKLTLRAALTTVDDAGNSTNAKTAVVLPRR